MTTTMTGINAIRESHTDYEILEAAKLIYQERMIRGETIASTEDAAEHLHARLHLYEHEVFCVLWLDKRHRVIACEDLATGTIDGASVYPREVVKAALKRNAAACIVAHNHPSGDAQPSQADVRITARLREALALVDVRLLDHIVVGGHETLSFSAQGITF